MSPWNGPGRPARPGARTELEPLLLEAVLGQGVPRAAARRQLASDPRSLRELRAFEARLVEARRELARVPGWDPGREQALVERILARTTRAEPPERRSPWWLALGAAAVLATAGALALRLASRPPALGETRSAARPEPAGLELEARAGSSPAGASRLAAHTTPSAPAARGADAAHASDGQAPLEVRLLEARAKGLREQRWETWLRELPPAELGSLSLALWCEVQLDRYVLSGDRPPGWTHVVGLLRSTLASPETPGEDSKLLSHALDRSHEYGLSGEVTVARLDPPRPLWSGEWIAALDDAGRKAGLPDSALWREWVDRRGLH